MESDDLIAISALQHAVYCLRQAALIHVERMWEENVATAEGRIVHLAVDEPGAKKRRGVRRVTAMPLVSTALRLSGTADLVEFLMGADGTETPFPVEFKRGKPKLHRADEVQLCAQALCIEEMTGRAVPEGALFYAEARRRTGVPFDAALRRLTAETAAALRAVFDSRQTPPAEYRAGKCRACSLNDLCRPKLSGRSARAFRERALADALAPFEPAP